MKKLLLLITVALLLGGCVAYPGYYDSGYYGSPYGYVGPNINLYTGFYGGTGYYGGYGYYCRYGHYGGSGHYRGSGHYNGGHGGWHR